MTGRSFLAGVEHGLRELEDLPALIAWADSDIAFRDSERRQWEQRLPYHTTVSFEGVGTADDLLALSRGFDLPIGFFLTPPGDDPRRVRIATPDTRKQGGADAMVLLDAVLRTEESLEVWEQVLATSCPGPGALSLFAPAHCSVGSSATPRRPARCSRGLLAVLEADDEPEAADATRPRPTKRARSKPAE